MTKFDYMICEQTLTSNTKYGKNDAMKMTTITNVVNVGLAR